MTDNLICNRPAFLSHTVSTHRKLILCKSTDRKQNLQNITSEVKRKQHKQKMSASSTTATNANIEVADADGVTALHHAACAGDVKEVERLLASGANVDARTRWLETPLHLASRCGRLEVVRVLLKHGANINACADDGQSCLYVATSQQHVELVEFLLYKDANFYVADHEGWTPLHDACGSGSVAICELLIAFGASVECVNDDDDSALMRAVCDRNVDVVRLLLELNADTTKRAVGGWTVSQTDNEVIKQLLLEHLKKSESERQEKRIDTLNRICNTVSIRLMRYAHPDIIDICLALAPFDLPPYVLLWTIDWLPQFARLSHHKKIHLIQSVWNSVRKINERKQAQQRFGLRQRRGVKK